MNAPDKSITALKRERPASAFIPYSSHLTETIIQTGDGDYVATLRLQGAAHESADPADINSWHEQLGGFLRNISSPKVSVWSHIVRRRFNRFPGGDFDPGFCADLNERYRQQMADDETLINELYLTLIYRPEPVMVKKLMSFIKPPKNEIAERMNDNLSAMTDLINTALSALDRYEPTVLGCYEHKGHRYSESLEFLAYLINGTDERVPLARSPIRDMLTTSRPFFGSGGGLFLKTPTDTIYGAMLTIQEYPSATCPGLLNGLLGAPFEFVLSQSITFVTKQAALGRMDRQQRRMIQAGDVAVSQIEDITDALDDLASNRFVMGTHHLSLLIKAADAKTLNKNIGIAGAELSDAGMKWAREDIGLASAFYAQLPGNFGYRVRTGDITSRNFCGFCSLHNYPMGRIDGNQWGDALTMFRTSSGAPYYFSFHKGEQGDARKAAKLDPNHKELANTVVIGKSGTGKTVLEMFLLAQAQKFHQPANGKTLTCVLFDKDLGASVGVRAMGGRYFPLKNGMPSGFNPFQMEATPNNITFLEKLVQRLVHHEGLTLSPREERQISNSITGLMRLEKGKRRLSGLMEFFDPTDPNGIAARLSKWCGTGPLAWLFDNAEDTLQLDNCTMVGFDVTEFLDNDATRTPTIMYLFHRIESLIDGRRIPIFLDEFWKLLGDPAFEDLAQNKLVTIRKQDGFLVMFTQSPKQVLKSPIAYAIIGQTATKIFLPNPEADYEDYVNGFKLTVREYEIVKSLGEKSRQFLIKQGDNSVVAELNLRGFDDELAVLSGNTATSNLAEKLVAELGTDPDVWLPEFHRIRKENH